MEDHVSEVLDDTPSVASVMSNLEGLGTGDESKGAWDQSSFFRSVEEGNTRLLQILLKNRAVDINGYNDQGMTALHVAVHKYDTRRKLDIVEILLKYGANVCLKAAVLPQACKLSLVRHESKSHSSMVHETRKIIVGQKTPLLLALELKSALYLRGWDYRHWDPMLKVLAEATCHHLSETDVYKELRLAQDISNIVKRGWNNVFQTGNHDLVQVSAEGTELTALKLLLSGASKKFKYNLENMAVYHSNTLELKDVSFNIAKMMVKFVYTGTVEPEFMEHRGIELLQAAHKYGLDHLKSLCEEQIIPTPENWIKLLTAAIEMDSDVLALKCSQSIVNVMTRRHEDAHVLKKSFSESDYMAPHQLFSPH